MEYASAVISVWTHQRAKRAMILPAAVSRSCRWWLSTERKSLLLDRRVSTGTETTSPSRTPLSARL